MLVVFFAILVALRPNYLEMFRSLEADLPRVTQLVLGLPWMVVAPTLVVGLALVSHLVSREPHRLLLAMTSATLSLAAVVITLWAYYLPLFSLAR